MMFTHIETNRSNHDRDGVTLIEVIFAMGVALVGLVGLISILPVAGRRAQDAIHLNDGSALAHSVFDELRARGLLKRSAWRVRSDYDRPNDPATIDPDRRNRSGVLIADSVDNGMSFCIDPLFVSSPTSAIPEKYDVASGNGYRRMLFPFYRAEHNPLVDPSLNDTNSSNGPATTRWFSPNANGGHNAGSIHTNEPAAFGCRMIRVGLAGPAGIQNARESEHIVDSQDGIAVFLTKDRSLNVTLQGHSITENGFQFGKHLSDGQLSWIATCNQLPGTNFMSVSVVILANRDRNFITPETNSEIASKPEGNATSERVGYVGGYTGFVGGAGGSVNLIAAANVSSKLAANDWVMLSKRTPNGALHRWYRVVSVGSEPTFGSIPDPASSSTQRNVWQNQVFLDGPDWDFNFATGQVADTSVADNTYVTMLDGVVAVSEHVIQME